LPREASAGNRLDRALKDNIEEARILTSSAEASVSPLRPEDLYCFTWVSDPQLSPDGRLAAYVVTKPEEKGKKYRSEIWVLRVSGGDPAACGAPGGRRFTAGPRDKAPRWSPDGRLLAFLSDRAGDSQLFVMRTDGGEAEQLTRLAGGVSEPCWAPDSRSLAFLARVASNEGPTRAKDGGGDAKDGQQSDVRIYSRLHYKDNGKGLWDGKRSHVFTVAIGDGEPRQITEGPYDDSAPSWSPCGTLVAFSSNRSEDPDRTPVSDIFVVPGSGGAARKLTRSEGPAAQPSWSPDGKWLAYYGHRNEYRGATLTRIKVVPADGTAAPRDVAEGWDRSPGIAGGSDMMTTVSAAPWWSAGGSWIYFLAGDRGATDLFRVATGGQAAAPERLTAGKHTIYGISLAADASTAVAAVATQTDPGNLRLLRPGQEGPPGEVRSTALTDVNPWLSERAVVQPEEFSVQGPDGEEIHGWIMKPTRFRPGTKYPLVLEIHGGPHAAYGYGFFHEFQVLCGEGFGVFFPNPPGSSSYGQAFEAATHQDWGGRDFRALMAAVDEATALDWVDGERLGVTGGSFGGYMTNWIIGQTDRFKAAVTQRSTCNRYSQFGTSDIGYFQGEFEFRGNPWEEPDFYLSRSPIAYVNRVTTPLLFIHSENDLRCPIGQAEEFYTALRWLGKTAELARFPDENHELSRSGQPIHRVERLTLIAEWFKKYLGGGDR